MIDEIWLTVLEILHIYFFVLLACGLLLTFMCIRLIPRNCKWWLLRCMCPICVHHAVRRCTNWHNSPPCCFSSFIREKVIQTFKHQRGKHDGNQFAVIFVVYRNDVTFNSLWFIKQFRFHRLKSNGTCLEYNTLVNRIKPYYPSHRYGNYIVARSDQTTSFKCAESFLLDNFYKIWSSGKEPQYIVLYAWAIPCTSCTQEILTKLDIYLRSVKGIIIAYSKSLGGHDTRGNIKDLRKAGFTVTHIEFNKPLDGETGFCTVL